MTWLNSVVLIEAENLVIGHSPVGVVTNHALREKNLRVLNVDICTSMKLSTQDLIVKSNINYTAATKPPSLVTGTNEHLWGGACMGWPYFHKKDFPVVLMHGIPISEVHFDQASKKLKKILRVTSFIFFKCRPNFNLKKTRLKGLKFVFVDSGSIFESVKIASNKMLQTLGHSGKWTSLRDGIEKTTQWVLKDA
jgi:hypothetical protein